MISGRYEITADASAKGFLKKQQVINVIEGFDDILGFEFLEADKLALLAKKDKEKLAKLRSELLNLKPIGNYYASTGWGVMSFSPLLPLIGTFIPGEDYNVRLTCALQTLISTYGYYLYGRYFWEYGLQEMRGTEPIWYSWAVAFGVGVIRDIIVYQYDSEIPKKREKLKNEIRELERKINKSSLGNKILENINRLSVGYNNDHKSCMLSYRIAF